MESLKSTLNLLCVDKLRDFNSGGIPFNLLVDLNYYQGKRLLVTPNMGGFFNMMVVDGAEKMEYTSNELPSNLSLRLCHIEPPAPAAIFIPEFRTILTFTEEFERRAGDTVLGVNKKNNLTSLDWIMTMLRLNMYTLQNKVALYKRYYLGEGKIKGLSRRELDYIKDTLVPIYVRADIESVMNSPNAIGTFIQSNLRKASIFLDRFIVTELQDGIRVDSKVYFGGYKCFRDETNSSRVCYYPKASLMDKGHRGVLEFYKYLVDKVNSMPIETLDSIFHEAKPVAGFEIDEEDNGESA